MSIQEPPLLEQLDTDRFRQRLAGLIDSQAGQAPEHREQMKELAVRFTACLPELYGDELDRKSLWDRIGSGLEAAFAKTPGDDHEAFIQHALEHIKASASRASSSAPLAHVIGELSRFDSADRQAWITYFHTHLIPILVHARNAWSITKAKRKQEPGT